MRRAAWIFLAAILLPSLGLAWLAIRSVRDQQVLLEHQEAIICQNQADALAQSIQQEMDNVRLDFVATAQRLQQESDSPQDLARAFDQRIRGAWPLAETGFAVGLTGEIYSPAAAVDTRTRQFRNDNDRFLSNRENAEVYFFNKASGNAQSVTINAPVGGTVALADEQRDLNSAGDNLRAPNQQQVTTSTTPPPVAPSPPADLVRKQALLEKQASAATPLPAPQLQTADDSEHPPPATGDNTTGLKDSNAKQEESGQQLEAQKETKTKAALDRSNGRAAAVPSAAATSRAKDEAAKKAQPMKSGFGSLSATGSDGLAPGSDAPAAATAVNAPAPPAPLTATDSSSVPAPTAPADKATFNVTTAPASAPASASYSGSLTPAPNEAPVSPGNAPVDAYRTVDKVSRSALSQNGIQQAITQKIARSVVPQQKSDNDAVSLSNTLPAESDFRQIVGNETSGELARFLDNKLCLLVWSHAAPDAPIIFGAQLNQARLIEKLHNALTRALTRDGFNSTSSNYCLAILDDTGHPVALSRTGFKADWKHPFVATEIGESLPHWEAALYLVDPQQITRTARTLRYTLALIVVVLVAAILAGGSVIASDIRRQVRLAQQKTDFVSNVSHELKTPLTSIRMFADLLAEKRVPDETRQAAYLRIIAAEAARLTRLINNVLDFARMERGKPPGEHQPCDLVDAVRDVIETCQPHLETSGVAFRSEIETDSLPLSGDRDALAQIILNLVSNAEKYGGGDITVRVRRQETISGPLGCVDVLDRGAGISPRDMQTIFEPFHRLDDSLASGVPGSGLGLTLARRMARAHHGDVTCSARAGGGTCFTLSVPLTPVTPKTS